MNISLTNVNDAPVATDNGYTLDEGALSSGNNIITNDTGDGVDSDDDLPGDTLTVASVNGVLWDSLSDSTNEAYLAADGYKEVVTTNGTVYLKNDGTMHYDHDDSDTISDSFTYTITDGTTTSNTATVSFTINPVDDCPEDNNPNDEHDVLVFSGNASVEELNGGDGFDIIVVNDTQLDLAQKPEELTNFERLHLCAQVENSNNYAKQELTGVTAQAVIDITDENNLLYITGDPADPEAPQQRGDRVELDVSPEEWVLQQEDVSYSGMTFDVYTNDGATIWVETDLTIVDTST